MQMMVTHKGVELDQGVREFVERRLAFALEHCDRWLDSVTVALRDVNGPKGGVDKQCRLVATLDGMPNVVIEDQAESLHAAVTNAAHRLGHTLSRVIDKRRSKALHHRDRRHKQW